MRSIIGASIVAPILLLSACSPYSYSKEVSSISDSVNKLSDAYTAGFSGIVANRAAETMAEATSARALQRKPKIAMPPSCVADLPDPKDPPCVLYVAGTEEPRWTEAEARRKAALDALKALKNYADALAAVTNAADRSAYDTAVGQLSGAVSSLAATASFTLPGAGAVVGAGINIFGWLVGTALDEQRYDTLRKAVLLVGKPTRPKEDDRQPVSAYVCYDPVSGAERDKRSAVRIVTDALCWGLETLGARQREILKAQGLALVNGLNYGQWSNADYTRALSDAQAAFAATEVLRKGKPGSAANALADAHDKLVAAVEDPSRQYPALMKAVGEFADKVAAVEAALKPPAKKGN